MDENVKNDAKQVMLVQNADDGRLQAVTGVDRDGNIQTADPTDQNVASLLNVNTQDSALEAFFKKFMEQAQNPVHTGIFVMTENALNKLIRIDFDPEILENYRIDPSERLQTQEQRQFEPLDVTKIDLADMEKKGIRMEDIEPHLKAMSYGHKSNGQVEMNPELASFQGQITHTRKLLYPLEYLFSKIAQVQLSYFLPLISLYFCFPLKS